MKHSVLVTGASTGIGLAIAGDLAAAGHEVFAGVRSLQDGERLKASHGLVNPVLIDVTKSSSIDAAFEEISKQRRRSGPFTLVNNAGIAVPGPVEAIKVSELRKQFEVNVFGLIETTQKFLPWIRDTQGRIINISSVSGRVSTPFLGAYSASKFALEALSDSLRQELAAFGVKVVLIEPGAVQSEIWRKGLENKSAIEEACSSERFALYRERMSRFEKIAQQYSKRALPASRVSQKVLSAVESKNPPTRIIVAPIPRKLEIYMAEWLPDRAFDLAIRKVLK